MLVTIVNYVAMWFQLEIKKLVDIKYAHLSILQVSFIIIKHNVMLNYLL